MHDLEDRPSVLNRCLGRKRATFSREAQEVEPDGSLSRPRSATGLERLPWSTFDFW